MRAADFRAAARQSLTGKWFLAVAVGLVAYLLGGGADSLISFNADISQGTASMQVANVSIPIEAVIFGVGWLSSAVVIAIAMAVIMAILGSVVEVGYADFNLALVEQRDARIEMLFGHFSNFKTAFCTRFLKWLYVLLWSLLFVIPGIVASYSYAMTAYILAEQPELTASEAIARSKELMRGNRWRLFCLQFSFIGWDILCAFTMGIGNLFLSPYRAAAEAAFYRDLTSGGSYYEVIEL